MHVDMLEGASVLTTQYIFLSAWFAPLRGMAATLNSPLPHLGRSHTHPASAAWRPCLGCAALQRLHPGHLHACNSHAAALVAVAAVAPVAPSAPGCLASAAA
eukprot:scaffold172917_cov23-Tisochrysis_lutea.AAC.1